MAEQTNEITYTFTIVVKPLLQQSYEEAAELIWDQLKELQDYAVGMVSKKC